MIYAAPCIGGPIDGEELTAPQSKRLRSILLFTKPREYTGHRLSQRKQFLFGHELVEEPRVVGNSAKPAADVDFEAALLHSVFDALHGNRAHVVQIRQTARIVLAA